MLMPLKLPTNAWLPWNAMSELANANEPGLAGFDQPGGLSTVGEQLHALRGHAGVVQARREPDPRVGRGRQLRGRHSRNTSERGPYAERR